jgi:hypothetical protein
MRGVGLPTREIMLSTAVILCTLAAVVGGQGFWSLALEDLNDDNGHFTRPDCTTYHKSGLLTLAQYTLCQEDSLVLAAISKGLKRAVYDCQREFQDEKWNCTAFSGKYLLGKGIETIDSRESAYIRTLIRAAILYDIAVACRENLLPQCPCYTEPPYIRRLPNGTILLSGCGDNLEYAKEKAKVFQESVSSQGVDRNLEERVQDHNSLLAENIVGDTVVECKCHGLSSTCLVSTCVRKIKPFTVSSEGVFKRYQSAVKVRSGVGNSLKSAGRGDNPTQDDLVYTQDSPDYCSPNGTLNILGTRGRSCQPNLIGSGSCDHLCCGRGYYSATKSVSKQVCKLLPLKEGKSITGFRPVCRTQYTDTLEHRCS